MTSFSRLALGGMCACALLSRIAIGQEAEAESLQPKEASALHADHIELTIHPNGSFSADNIVLNSNGSFSADSVALNLVPITYGNPFGVDVEAVDDILRSQLNIPEDAGVVITAVADDSEAAKAGLKAHDIVLQINDQPVAGPEQFNAAVAEEQGKTVTIQGLRRGQPLKIEVTMPRTPEYELALADQLLIDAAESARMQHYRIGVTLAEADDTLRSQLRLASGEGLVVTEVIEGGPAAKAGIKPHDVLTKLDGRRLSTVENINAQIQEIAERQVALDFIRAGGEQTCDVMPRLSNDEAFLRNERYLYLSNIRFANDLLSSAARERNIGAGIRWLVPEQQTADLKSAQPPVPAEVAGQIEELKRKLADVTQSLDALSAALQSHSSEEKPADEPQPEESKPE